jgi:hypothetical protein
MEYCAVVWSPTWNNPTTSSEIHNRRLQNKRMMRLKHAPQPRTALTSRQDALVKNLYYVQTGWGFVPAINTEDYLRKPRLKRSKTARKFENRDKERVTIKELSLGEFPGSTVTSECSPATTCTTFIILFVRTILISSQQIINWSSNS